MQELIQSYTKSIRETEKAIAVRKQLHVLTGEGEDCRTYMETNALGIYARLSVEALEQDIQILNASLNSMRHSVMCMRNEQSFYYHMRVGRIPTQEIAYDPEWLKLLESPDDFVTEIANEDEDVKVSQQEKAQLVNRMLSVLNKKQMVILELKAAQYSHAEIAAILKIPKGTVDVTVVRIRNIIEQEGWLML